MTHPLAKEWAHLFGEGKAVYPFSVWLERKRRQEERAFIAEFVDTFGAVEIETLEEGGRFVSGDGPADAQDIHPANPSRVASAPSSSVPTGSDQFPIPSAIQEQIAKQRSR